MAFRYDLIKKIRKEKLRLSRQNFCDELSKLSNGKFKLSIMRLSRLENGEDVCISQDDMMYIYEVIGETPNFFYGLTNDFSK